MADELTISEAVQRYEVSRKTVRRRLAEGAIDGARQRPGDHGPEWIFPAASLEALGYEPRREGGTAGAPGTAVSAISASERSFASEPRSGRSGRAAVWVVLAVVFGPLLGFLLATVLDTDDETPETAPVLAVLDELTRPGDRVGVVGATDTELPPGRVAVPVDAAELSGIDGAAFRYVVVVGDALEPAVTALHSTARLVLALETTAEPRWVFDIAEPPVPVSATSAVPSTTEAAAPPEAPAPEPGDTPSTTAAPPTTADPAPPVEGETDEAPALDDGSAPGVTVRGTVTVETGDHFWSIAEEIVAESLGAAPTDAQVTAYWAELIDANADQLVEPGNPDLLLPGQVLQLPSI